MAIFNDDDFASSILVSMILTSWCWCSWSVW